MLNEAYFAFRFFLLFLLDKMAFNVFYFGFTSDQRVSGFVVRKDFPKINFFNDFSKGSSFFDISRYLTDKYLDIIWWERSLKAPK